MTESTGSRRHALLVLTDRSHLGFSELLGEPLYEHALRALVQASGPSLVLVDPEDAERVEAELRRRGLPGTVVDDDRWWAGVTAAPGAGLLVHDPLCPLVTPDFLAAVAREADDRPGTALVAVRAVTDTLKAVVDGAIQQTIDRESVATVTSPVVIPREVLVSASAEPPPPVHDFAALVGWLRKRCEVELVRAPSLSRRVEHLRGVHLLECLGEVAHRVRAEAGHPPAGASAPEDRP